MKQIEITLIDIEDDFTQHVPLVLAHWERPFRSVYKCLRKEAHRDGYPQIAYQARHPTDTGVYLFEKYYIVLELTVGDWQSPLRIYFPDEATEMMILLKASYVV